MPNSHRTPLNHLFYRQKTKGLTVYRSHFPYWYGWYGRAGRQVTRSRSRSRWTHGTGRGSEGPSSWADAWWHGRWGDGTGEARCHWYRRERDGGECQWFHVTWPKGLGESLDLWYGLNGSGRTEGRACVIMHDGTEGRDMGPCETSSMGTGEGLRIFHSL